MVRRSLARSDRDLEEIANCFQNVRYAYLQIVKQRRKRRLVTVKQRIVQGKESDFSNKSQNTSYIERLNLTLRQKVSYLQRKTLGYCKNQKNFNYVLRFVPCPDRAAPAEGRPRSASLWLVSQSEALRDR